MTEPDLSQQLEAPLALLKSISEGALGSGQMPSQSQLLHQLSQLQSAVSDVLDLAASAMTALLEQVEDELAPAGMGLDYARDEFKAVSEELEDQLGILSDVLLGASNFEELGDAREEVEAVELAMQATLFRLEMLLDALVDGQGLEGESLPEGSRVEEASEVLELLAAALEYVDGHLSDGNLGHLRHALEQVDQAAEILRLALAQSEI